MSNVCCPKCGHEFEPPPVVPATEVKILEVLTKPMTLRQICNATGMIKGSARYTLRNLEDQGKVTHDEDRLKTGTPYVYRKVNG